MTDINSLIQYVASPLYRDNDLISTDRSILASRQVELIPQESSTFGSQSASGVVSSDTLNDRVTFRLSDPRHYVDWKNTYFQCNLKARAVNSSGFPLQAFLDHGGIHACIKNLIVRHGSAEIHRIEDYNKLYNTWKFSSKSKDAIDWMSDCGDSYADQWEDGDEKLYQPAHTIAEVAYDLTGGFVEKQLNLGTLGAAYTDLKVGDVLLIALGDVGGDIDPSVKYVRVTKIYSDQYISVEGLGEADIGAGAAGAFKKIELVKRGGLATRRAVVQDVAVASLEDQRISFQIPFGFMQESQYFPLPFMNQNLEISLEFTEPALSIVVPKRDAVPTSGPTSGAATSNLLGYAISDFRMVAQLVEPSAEVFEAHRRLWKEGGLVYNFMTARTYNNQIAAATTAYNTTYHSNIKSLQSVLAVMSPQATQSASGNSATAQAAYCQSAFLKNNLIDYRLRVGGMSFPDYGAVKCDSVACGQAWKMLQKANKGILADADTGSCIRPFEWNDVRSERFIMAMNLAKEHQIYNTGVDVSSNFLELELNFNTYSAGPPITGVAEAMNLYTYLIHDSAVVMSSQSGVRVYY